MERCKRQFMLLCFFVLTFCKAQPQDAETKKLDSLFAITKIKKDTAAVTAFLAINKHYFFKGMYDSAIYYCNQAALLAKKKNNYKIVDVYLATGKSYYMKSVNDSALLYLNNSEQFLPAANDETKVHFYSLLASVYQEKYDNEKAIELFLKAITILEKPENVSIRHLLLNTYGNIGGAFLKEKKYDKAIAFFDKAMTLKEYAQSKVHLIMIYQKYFICFTNTNQLDKAAMVLDSSMAILNLVNNLDMKQAVFVNYGLLNEKKKNFTEALGWYVKGLEITDSLDSDFYKARILNNLSSTSISLKDYLKAKSYAQQAIVAAKKYDIFEDLNYAYGNLKLVAKNEGNYKQALEYAELQFQYGDSASNNLSKEQVVMLEAKFENEKKEAAIAELQLSNTQKELAVVKRNRLLFFGSITAAGLLIILGLFVRSNRQKRIIAEKDQILKEEQIKFLERQQQVVSLQSMVNGQETERTRIAKDLHDGLGGLFSTIKMNFSSLQHENQELKNNPLFSKSYDMVDTASEEVRRIAHNMMPEVLIKLGLVQATKELCNSTSAGKLLQASLQAYGMEKRLNASTEIMLFRIIQELLNNIIKHANASEAIVQFNRAGNRLSVTVEDNGRGFNLQETDEHKHAGLESVQSRVNYLNGNLSIESQKEIGTTIMMDFLINE